MIYFIQQGEGGPIKIGSAENVTCRLISLQIASPVELKLLAIQTGSGSEEKELHRQFRTLWIRGEWFKPRKRLMSYIASIAGRPKKLKKKRRRLGPGEMHPPKSWVAAVEDYRSGDAERIKQVGDSFSKMPVLIEKFKEWSAIPDFGPRTVLTGGP